MIRTTLHCVRSVFLDIWRVERRVCFWSSILPQWVCQFIRSSHILFSTCMLQSAGLMPLVMIHVFQMFVSNMPSLSFLQLVFKNNTSIP